MIVIRQANNRDQPAWDEYVKQHCDYSPYHLYAWQCAVEQAYQHVSYSLIAEQVIDNINTIVGVLPLIILKVPFAKAKLCALPFCDIGGVLANSEDIIQLLNNESKKVAIQLQVKKIELRTSGLLIEKIDAKSTEKVSMLMQLPGNSELLFSSFKSKLRSQIRKADKNGLTYKLGSEKTMLDDFYQVFSHNMRSLGSPVHSKQWFTSLLEYYQEKMIISVVYKEDLPIGAGIVLLSENKAAIPWASTKAEYNRLSPNMMLYWSLLKHLSDNNINYFDFGRSSYGEGTYKFKQQWGAKPRALIWQILTIPSGELETDSSVASNGKLRTIVENIWRKLPLNLTVFLGPKIRKYISL